MLDATLKEKITIEVSDEKEQDKIANFIHEQLIGNSDYVNNNIVFSIETENVIVLDIFKEASEIPVISI